MGEESGGAVEEVALSDGSMSEESGKAAEEVALSGFMSGEFRGGCYA